jgi:hypothetical protein
MPDAAKLSWELPQHGKGRSIAPASSQLICQHDIYRNSEPESTSYCFPAAHENAATDEGQLTSHGGMVWESGNCPPLDIASTTESTRIHASGTVSYRTN